MVLWFQWGRLTRNATHGAYSMSQFTSTYNSSRSACQQVRSTIIEAGNGHYSDILIAVIDERSDTATLVITHEDGSVLTQVVGIGPREKRDELALRNAIVRSGFRLFDEVQLSRLVRACFGR